MRRRALLTSLGAVTLSGCSGVLTGRGDTTDATERPTTRTTETKTVGTTDAAEVTETAETTESAETTEDENDANGWPPRASVVDLQTGPRTLALSPRQYRSNDGAEVTVEFASTATAGHPATVRATLTNATDYENTFRLDETPPFGEVTEARLRDRRDLTYKSSWYLVPTENHDLVDDSPDYARGPEGYWRLVGNPSPRLPSTARLKSGETVDGEYVLLGHGEGSGRPTGTYEFRGHADAAIAITAWDSDAPGPEGTSKFASASPPPLSNDGGGGDSGETRWYHDAGPKTPVYLEPSTEHAHTPARIDFVLYNHARKPLKGNPYDWTLYKFADGEWFHLAPWAIPAPLSSVSPGGTEDWTLYAFYDAGLHIEDGVNVGFLGSGRYAFEVGMSRDERSHAAVFELSGPDVRVVPMPGTESSRDGRTVTVDSPDDERDQRSGTLTLTRADEAVERLLAEQVMQPQFRALRNGLPFFDRGVERVVVNTTENAAQRVVGYGSPTRRFRFDGRAYEARFDGESSG